jgi:hypothetical protein
VIDFLRGLYMTFERTADASSMLTGMPLIEA